MQPESRDLRGDIHRLPIRQGAQTRGCPETLSAPPFGTTLGGPRGLTMTTNLAACKPRRGFPHRRCKVALTVGRALYGRDRCGRPGNPAPHCRVELTCITYLG